MLSIRGAKVLQTQSNAYYGHVDNTDTSQLGSPMGH